MQPQKPQQPSKPAPPKGPYEKRGSIPREKFPYLFRQGPYSMPWSRKKGRHQLKEMGKKILKERFPGSYGREISGGEIQREINKLKRVIPKTGVQRDALRETMGRLEEAKKRAGL